MLLKATNCSICMCNAKVGLMRYRRAAQMIFHVWRTNPTLLQKMAQEIVRRALQSGPPPHNLAGLKLVLH